MTTKYTPGPWDVFMFTSPLGISSQIFKKGDDGTPSINIAHILMTWNGDGSNARLIAAAPDMAEALVEAVRVLRLAIREACDVPGFNPDDHVTIARCLAALLKAGLLP